MLLPTLLEKTVTCGRVPQPPKISETANVSHNTNLGLLGLEPRTHQAMVKGKAWPYFAMAEMEIVQTFKSSPPKKKQNFRRWRVGIFEIGELIFTFAGGFQRFIEKNTADPWGHFYPILTTLYIVIFFKWVGPTTNTFDVKNLYCLKGPSNSLNTQRPLGPAIWPFTFSNFWWEVLIYNSILCWYI